MHSTGAGTRSAHTQNTSTHNASMRTSMTVGARAGENRVGSRHDAGTKGAETRMAARAGTGYGVYTMSASSVHPPRDNLGGWTTNCTGTPNAQYSNTLKRW